MAPRSVDEELEEELENPEEYEKFCKSLAEFAEQREYEDNAHSVHRVVNHRY